MNEMLIEADKKANEVQEYCEHVDALIERRRLEIKTLNGLIQVCRRFDGKVLSDRFHDAVKKKTGFFNLFFQSLNYYELEDLGREFFDGTPRIYIKADWSHGIAPWTGEKQEVSPKAWQWDIGDRLEAEKAIAVIEHYKNDRLVTIKRLRASKKKYAAYLRLARKANAILKKMEDYDCEIHEFAYHKAISERNSHAYFWKEC